METAGKQVDDEDLRELMKENGGRPSTRANIIETLFKRQYIVRNKKQVLPGDWYSVGTIQNDLVKSSGINGILGKAVKDIEKELYRCSVYQQHETDSALVYEVRSETTRQYFACGKYSKQEVKVEKRK
jgi:DNA topoisomerase-3